MSRLSCYRTASADGVQFRFRTCTGCESDGERTSERASGRFLPRCTKRSSSADQLRCGALVGGRVRAAKPDGRAGGTPTVGTVQTILSLDRTLDCESGAVVRNPAVHVRIVCQKPSRTALPGEWRTGLLERYCLAFSLSLALSLCRTIEEEKDRTTRGRAGRKEDSTNDKTTHTSQHARTNYCVCVSLCLCVFFLM